MSYVVPYLEPLRQPAWAGYVARGVDQHILFLSIMKLGFYDIPSNDISLAVEIHLYMQRRPPKLKVVMTTKSDP